MKILVAHDGSTHSTKALDVATGVAEKFGGAIKIVSVVPDLCLSTEELSATDCEVVANSLYAETRGLMTKIKDSMAAKGVSVEIVIRGGRPVDQIVDAAEEFDADLVVVGSHGRHGAKRFLMGSVSEGVAQHCKKSVLIVK